MYRDILCSTPGTGDAAMNQTWFLPLHCLQAPEESRTINK